MLSDWARLGKDGTLLYRPLTNQYLPNGSISVVTITGNLQQPPLNTDTDTQRAAADLSFFQSTAQITVYLNRSTLESFSTPDTKNDEYWREIGLIGNSPDDLFKLVSYYLSDVIIVQHDSVREAATEYMEWARVCRRLKRSSRQSPPYVLVYIRDGHVSIDDWNRELSSIYINVNDVRLEKFTENLSNPCITPVGADLEALTMELASQAYEVRQSNRHVWSNDEFTKLHEQLVHSFCDGSRSSFAEVDALSALSTLRESSRDWKDEMDYSDEIVVHLLSSNLARYAVNLQHGE